MFMHSQVKLVFVILLGVNRKLFLYKLASSGYLKNCSIYYLAKQLRLG